VFGGMPGAQFTDEEGADILNDMIGGGHTGAGAAEDGAGEEETEEIIEVVDADTGKSIGKRKPWGPAVGTHHSKWTSLEDECLIDSWIAVSLDPITGANQTLSKYYTRILDEFNERHHIGDYAKIHMNRNESAISHRWGAIKTICNKFHGHLETIRNTKQSGASNMDYVSTRFDLCSMNFTYGCVVALMCAFLVVA
jgi:hypothetical protein